MTATQSDGNSARESYPFTAIAGGQSQTIDPRDLREAQARASLVTAWRTLLAPVILVLANLLRWSDEERHAVFGVLRALQGRYVLQTAANGCDHPNLFDLALTMMAGPEDVERCDRGRRAAIEAAVLVHPNALLPACNLILQRLQELDVRGYRIEGIVREANSVAAVFRAAEGGESVTPGGIRIVDRMPDAPVTQDAVVPPGYDVSGDGILAVDHNSVKIATRPVVIIRRYRDIRTGKELVELGWERDGAWSRRLVPRGEIATAREIAGLADYGLPVTSNTAADLVEYLAAYEAANIETCPVEQVSSQLGWQGHEGVDGFLWGRTLIGGGNGTADPTVRSPVSFRGSDAGDEQLASSFRTAGSPQAWLAGLELLRDFPRVRLGVIASLAAPLLAILRTRNAVLSFAGATSMGKTTSLKIAGSCWGQPVESFDETVIGSWNSTRVWIERAAAVRCDLPLFLDGTKRARRPEDVAQTLYDVEAGHGRGRGSIESLRASCSFRTVLIATGEAPITSFTQDGGTRARVLELWGSPFGRADAQTAQLVASLNRTVSDNYGHAGPHFAAFLACNKVHWQQWREWYGEAHHSFMSRAGDNSVAGRMAGDFALFQVTAHLAAMAGVVPWQGDDVVSQLWPELTSETTEADRAAAALRCVWGWACANRASFLGLRTTQMQPPSGWAGRWDEQRGWVAFFEERIVKILQDAKFDAPASLRMWHDRGWLRRSQGRNYYRCRVDGQPQGVDMVCIQLAAIAEVSGGEGDGED